MTSSDPAAKSEVTGLGAFPLPPEGGEVARRSCDGAGDGGEATRSRWKPSTTARARQLRKAENQAEALLWRELKARRLGGFRFTHQFPLGPFFADFACRAARLIVEIDGSQHADRLYDLKRDDSMRAAGYSVLRLWAHDVLKERRAVCETILAALRGRLAEEVVASDLRFAFAAAGISSSRTLESST